MNSLRVALSSVLILVITFIAFAPCLKNGFIDSWDDREYVTQNTAIQYLSPYSMARIFSTFFASTYLPLTMLSYMLDYRFFRLNPFGYHLTNLIFHLLNCLLVFWLVRLLSRNALVSFIVAIFFGVHPLHVESVAWISERKDVLYSFFFLLSMICYCHYLQTQKIGRAYWLAMVFFVFSLLSKAMAITLPLLLLLTDYFKGRKYDRGMIVDKIPFLIFAVCFGILGIYGQGPALRHELLLGFFDKCLIPSYAVIFYLGKILLPVGLSCVYPYSGIKDISIYLFSLAGCFAIPVLMIRSARYTKKAVFSILFFLVTLLPVLQFIPIGSTIVADRYAYMASVGFFYLIAEGIVWAYRKTAEKNRRLGVALIIVFLILITGSLSVLTWNRCTVWKDDIALWGDALSKYPNALAYNRRGIYFSERKDYDRALGDFKKVLLYAPYDTDVYINLGNLYNAMGENHKAITTFKQGLKMGTEPAVSYFSLATTYSKLGNNETAISFYKKTLELVPDNAVVCYSLGMLYKKLGKNDDAIQMLSRTVKIAPGFLLPYSMLSQLYEEAGKREEQFALYRQAIAHDVPFYTAYYDIGNLDLEQGDIKSSIRMFQKAVEISPSSAGYVSLASAYCALGQTKKAIPLLTKALGMNPKIAVAHNNIAVAYYYQKQYDLAILHCDKAIELGYKVAPKLLGLLKPFRKQFS